MRSRISLRVEILAAALVVVVAAVLFRYAWLPVFWEDHLAAMSTKWGLPVTGVGRWFSAWTLGDGQAFALIAADPLGLDEVSQLGHPAYRFMRAGFGWLAWLASLGRAELVPYGMAIVGALAVAGTFMAAARLRTRLGWPAWLIVLNPAVFIGFAGDTAEALGVLFLALGMATSGKWAPIALGVTRPSYLVALAGQFRKAMWGGAAALLLLLYGLSQFGFDFDQFGGRLGIPVVGYLADPDPMSGLVGLLALGTLIVGVRHRDWSWIASGIFVLSFASDVVADPINAWRAAGMLPVLWAFGPGYEVSAAASTVGEPVPAPT